MLPCVRELGGGVENTHYRCAGTAVSDQWLTDPP